MPIFDTDFPFVGAICGVSWILRRGRLPDEVYDVWAPKRRDFFLCFRPFVSFVEGRLLQHCNLLGRPQGVYDLPMKILWVLMCLHEPVVLVIFVVQACCRKLFWPQLCIKEVF
jgi:hypothetical protein